LLPGADQLVTVAAAVTRSPRNSIRLALTTRRTTQASAIVRLPIEIATRKA
jgi:hypothetical protein